MEWSLKKRSVLVPFDFSAGCRLAIEVARTFVDADTWVVVLHVVRPPAASYPGVMWAELDAESIRSRAHAALTKELETLGVGAEAVTKIGSPPNEILERARKGGTELIIMPSRGRTGLERFLLGSVTERVVRESPVPVLVLRAEEE
jgi:nucleotide-binding universal stress UspA family protein